MDEAYAVKQTEFLGKTLRYVCQNGNGPCPLLAIANVLLLRGQLTLEGAVTSFGFVGARDLMRLVQQRLLETNPPLKDASELQRLTQEKTLEDVVGLLPNMLRGLDVNVRFHKITDFEYTVACAVFDMLDMELVHGWLLDDQDDLTMKVVGNKSYNELIERLVDYRGLLLTEEENKRKVAAEEKKYKGDALLPDAAVVHAEKEGAMPVVVSVPAPLDVQTLGLRDLSLDAANDASAVPNGPESVDLDASTSSPQKSPLQQTVQAMMKERHMSDADALVTATTLLEEGPVLDAFFSATASQLTYYGLVKLHEGLRERQLCVFFRNNHFSTLFKFGGKLYLLITDAGYLDEPTVVWELLNEIDGDTEYLDAQFRPVTLSEQQTSILTQQQEQEQAEKQTLQEARVLSLAKCVSPPIHAKQEVSAGDDARATEHAMSSGESVSESVGQNVDNVADPDYLLALKIQQEEEELARGSGHVSSPHLSNAAERDPAGNSHNEGSVERHGSGGQDDDHGRDTNTIGLADDVVAANGQLLLSEEELEAQRRAEQYYEEHKRQVDAQTRQCEQEQERLRHSQQQQQQQRPTRSSQRRRISESSDCTVS
uniref:MINDY deubiquitinase domain-containing protein n=1 Tax=Peronospora matthiolae TaxID=2874970 RepID=A0AAV1UHP6_9STRA